MKLIGGFCCRCCCYKRNLVDVDIYRFFAMNIPIKMINLIIAIYYTFSNNNKLAEPKKGCFGLILLL